jgi:hypothetical protein
VTEKGCPPSCIHIFRAYSKFVFVSITSEGCRQECFFTSSAPKATPYATITLRSLFRFASVSLASSTTIYSGLLNLLTIPLLQTHVFYLHHVTLTWQKDLNVPESFGFLHNQVTPFSIGTPNREILHAWHVLPSELYRRNERQLIAQPSDFATDIASRLAFQLLRDDSDARLVLYLHSTVGGLGSGWRPASYRALYSGTPINTHPSRRLQGLWAQQWHTLREWPPHRRLCADRLGDESCRRPCLPNRDLRPISGNGCRHPPLQSLRFAIPGCLVWQAWSSKQPSPTWPH